MKVRLLFPDREADTEPAQPDQATDELTRDLGLTDVADLMAAGDPYVRDVALRTLQKPLADAEALAWRQAVLRDALGRPEPVRRLYDLAGRALAIRTGVRTWRLADSPGALLDHAVGVLTALLGPLRELRALVHAEAPFARSGGTAALFADVTAALPPDWFGHAEQLLDRLRFPHGLVITGRVGTSALVTDLTLRESAPTRRTWREALGPLQGEALAWSVPDEDSAGTRALRELRDRALAPLADVLTRAADQTVHLFAQLRWQTAFLVGCLTLRDRLAAAGLGWCVPQPRPADEGTLTARGLVDVGLLARGVSHVVGNDLSADGRRLVVVTGANQGGKSTLLRGLGLAHLLMQSGCVVGAESFVASTAPHLHTHFRREEDRELRSGKLDEELTRMSALVDRAGPGDLVLLNESFASTHEVEGAAILRQVVDGLTDAGLRVACVTHLHEFSQGVARDRPDALFLRAERLDDGSRTFRVTPGAPRPTSFGADLWRAVMGED